MRVFSVIRESENSINAHKLDKQRHIQYNKFSLNLLLIQSAGTGNIYAICPPRNSPIPQRIQI